MNQHRGSPHKNRCCGYSGALKSFGLLILLKLTLVSDEGVWFYSCLTLTVNGRAFTVNGRAFTVDGRAFTFGGLCVIRGRLRPVTAQLRSRAVHPLTAPATVISFLQRVNRKGSMLHKGTAQY